VTKRGGGVIYYFLALLTGVLITVMVAFNGQLTAAHGIYTATVIIHVVGLAFVSVLLVIKREAPFLRRAARESSIPPYMYLGGAVGVITVVLTNYAFGQISVSALMALGLFGQSLGGIAVDQFGLFGMDVHPFNKKKVIGLVLMLCGVGVMLAGFGDAGRGTLLAALAAFGTGASIVTSRVLNARLAAHIGTRRGVWICHVMGLLVALPVLFLAGRGELGTPFVFSPQLFIYIGGIMGVVVIMTDNITAVRIPAFYLALLLFVGQISAGMGVDFVLERTLSIQNILGAGLVAAGLCVNVIISNVVSK
jgi:transporter family-2 protein